MSSADWSAIWLRVPACSREERLVEEEVRLREDFLLAVDFEVKIRLLASAETAGCFVEARRFIKLPHALFFAASGSKLRLPQLETLNLKLDSRWRRERDSNPR